MEVFAGFVEHVDAQVGRLVDGLEEMGLRDNTIIFYVFGDNGSSAEGQNGTISELLAQNMIPNTIEQQLAALDKIGGLDALGTAKTDNMYHAGWAWAGDTPFRYTKLVASHFGGTRNPLVISWPKGIKPDKTPRPQFHHVNDIAPTIYDILGIKPPDVVDGWKQLPIDGVSMAYAFGDPNAPGRKLDPVFREQRQPRDLPRRLDRRRLRSADPMAAGHAGARHMGRQQGSLGALRHPDTTSRRPTISPDKEPERLAEMKKLFLTEAKDNQVFPVGAGLWTRLHPEDRVKVPYTHWDFDSTTTRLPEFAGPGLGRESNRVVVDVEMDRERVGRHLCARRNRRRPDPLHGQGPARLRIQHDDDRAVHRPLRRADRPRQASDRRRHVDRQARRPRGRRDQRRRAGGDARRRQADRRRRVLRERNARRRRRPRFAGVVRLFRPRSRSRSPEKSARSPSICSELGRERHGALWVTPVRTPRSW